MNRSSEPWHNHSIKRDLPLGNRRVMLARMFAHRGAGFSRESSASPRAVSCFGLRADEGGVTNLLDSAGIKLPVLTGDSPRREQLVEELLP